MEEKETLTPEQEELYRQDLILYGKATIKYTENGGIEYIPQSQTRTQNENP